MTKPLTKFHLGTFYFSVLIVFIYVLLLVCYPDWLLLTIDVKNLYVFCTVTNILFLITLPVSEDGFHLQGALQCSQVN